MRGAVAERFDQAEAALEEPVPLRPVVEKAGTYPLDALGPTLSAAARAIMDTVRVPDSLAAQTVLATASLVLQPHIDIELPMGDVMPTSLFMVTVAASGDRKSAADRRALASVYEKEEFLRREWEEAAAAHKIDMAAFKSAESVAKQKNKDSGDLRTALKALGAEPTPPVQPFILVDKPTAQGLEKAFHVGRPTLGLFSDEGGAFFGGYAMNDDNRLATSTILSSLWDGKPIKKNTAGETPMFMPGRRLAFHLMMQPGVAGRLFGAAELKDQGFMSRLLVAAPTTLRGQRLYEGYVPSPASEPALRAYRERVASILARALPMPSLPDMQLKPKVVELSDAAAAAWRKFHDEVERRIGPDGEWESIAGFAAKLPEHAARLAAVVANFGEWTPQLSVTDLMRGMELAQFYAGEMLRLSDTAVPDEMASADLLREWLVNKWARPFVGMRHIQSQLTPRSMRALGANNLRQLCEVLVQNGHLIECGPKGHVIDGKRNKEAWRVVGVVE